MPDSRPLVIIAGPTACGKSALALAVAEEFGGWIVNADSMQVYADLRLLTARPDAAEEARVPHRLYGVLDADDHCSAGRWLEMARDAVAEARAAGALPVVVGGTGLYLKVLAEGLAPVPPVPDDVAAAAAERYDAVGGDAFRDELAAFDPAAAARLHAADSQRLVRAMAVAQATGRPLGDWQRDVRPAPGVGGRVATILVMPPREALYAAIDARFDAMMAAGALDEVHRLLARAPAPRSPLTKAVGVPELAAHLAGTRTLDDAVAAAKQASRNLAKRQMTWFRNQIRADFTLGTQFSERNNPEIFRFIRQFLLTTPL